MAYTAIMNAITRAVKKLELIDSIQERKPYTFAQSLESIAYALCTYQRNNLRWQFIIVAAKRKYILNEFINHEYTSVIYSLAD